MKLSRFLAVLLLAAAHVVAQNAPVAPAPNAEPEIATVRDPYQRSKEALIATEEKSLENLQAWYVTNLEKLQAETTQAGNLDHVLIIRQEKQRVTEHEKSTAEQIEAMPAPLRTLRTSYEGGMKKIRDEIAARQDLLSRKYLIDLESLQTRITKSGDIERALLVKGEKDRIIAERAANETVAAIPPPAALPGAPAKPKVTPPPTITLGMAMGPRPAKVEVREAIMSPLGVGEQVLSDTNKVHWVTLPKGFEGYQFTKLKSPDPYLHFKVLSEGVVYMACTSRFGVPTKEGWPSEVTTAEQLVKKGWRRERNADFTCTERDHQWWVFSRTCRTGEEFNYRTEKFRAPILLVK